MANMTKHMEEYYARCAYDGAPKRQRLDEEYDENIRTKKHRSEDINDETVFKKQKIDHSIDEQKRKIDMLYEIHEFQLRGIHFDKNYDLKCTFHELLCVYHEGKIQCDHREQKFAESLMKILSTS